MNILNILFKHGFKQFFIGILSVALIGGCVVSPKLYLKVNSTSFETGTIVAGESGQAISFESMMSDLKKAQVIYVGEKHNNHDHHQIQLRVIEDIYAEFPDMIVGMEMFARPYQSILDEWSSGILDENNFLKRVHWYSNWRHDFALYRNILTFIKDNNIRLIGLNVPFHIPSKIAVGGIDSLLEDDRKHLPENIDTSVTAHREYIREVFDQHHVKGRRDFESFYMAQCVWEDAMAETIAENLKQSKMVVLVGNGHIYRKFGIPQRAFNRTGRPFRTLYPVVVGGNAQLDDADYLWATTETKRKRFHRSKH